MNYFVSQDQLKLNTVYFFVIQMHKRHLNLMSKMKINFRRNCKFNLIYNLKNKK